MQKAILVSGAGGGIGKSGCRQLVAAGFKVFAGAISEAEAHELAAIDPAIQPVILDVTRQDSIDAAMDFVRARLGEEALYGFWNNAGIMRIAAFENLEPADIRKVVEVNLLGTLLAVHAALPLLAKGRSRIVITGSATGMLAGPAVSTYSATKWGIEGFVDALRIELSRVGIALSLIQPGLIKTPMADRAPIEVDALLQRISTTDRSAYEPLVKTIAQTSANASTPAERVADAVIDAFTSSKPKPRYRVGKDSHAVALLRHLPDQTKDYLQRKIFGI